MTGVQTCALPILLLDDIDQERIDQLESGLSVSDLDKRLFLHKKDQEVVRLIEATVKQKQLGSVKGIVFCRNIRHLQHLLGFFEAGTATCVHSRMPEAQRRENIRHFREGELNYILVCDLFNEGIDIPETNLLVFMRYTGSKTVWLQQLGRGLRKTANKDCVHVLDFVGSLDRLKDVQQLVKAVQSKRQKQPSEGDLDEAHDEQQSLHDDTIEVTYSQSAARVLELIERLHYRLNSRETLVEQLRRYYEVTGGVPLIEELESSLDDLSVDQVATHFDSYQGFLLAAFGWHAETAVITGAVADAYAADLAKHGLPPSPKALALQFQHKTLPWLTVSEMARIIAPLQARLPLDGPAGSEQADPALEATEIDTPRPAEPPELPPMTAQENVQQALLAQYRGVINNRTDLSALSQAQLDEITRLFRSASVFLMRLRSSEHA